MKNELPKEILDRYFERLCELYVFAEQLDSRYPGGNPPQREYEELLARENTFKIIDSILGFSGEEVRAFEQKALKTVQDRAPFKL